MENNDIFVFIEFLKSVPTFLEVRFVGCHTSNSIWWIRFYGSVNTNDTFTLLLVASATRANLLLL